MSTTILEPRASGHACNCRCADCTGECCELECLVQPRFFCGQLLTDQDLSVMLDWVKGKTALTRYRHGWGVVCGLEVSYGAEAGSEGHVSVLPGYAVDCCGNDVIVCERATLDLSKFCKPEQDPCSDRPLPPPPSTDDVQLSFGGWKIPKSEVQAVDLFARYSETASGPRNALARGGCNAVEACEYTRTHEGYELYAKKVEHCEHSADGRVEAWQEEYRRGLVELFETLRAMRVPVEPRRTAERLGQWLRGRPLRSFGFVREWLCEIARQNEPPPQGWYDQIVFWIIQDWRNHYFRCDCYGCGPEAGVPLARVWLWRQRDADGKHRCKVIYVNDYPPFRRPLRQDCWPAPPDHFSLAPFIWQPVDYVITELRKLSFDNVETEHLPSVNLYNLSKQLGAEQLFVPSWTRREDELLVIIYEDDNCGQNRVVSFRSHVLRPIMTQPLPATMTDAARASAEDDSKELDFSSLDALAPDDTSLDVRDVPGIGPKSAAKLKEGGIENLRMLADADAAGVTALLSTLRINPPDEARSKTYIDEARERIKKLIKKLNDERQGS